MPRPLIVLPLLLLVACAGVPATGDRPALRAGDSIAAGQSLAPGSGEWPGEGWWQGYADGQLAALVNEGLANSPDVAAADARLRRAAGMAQTAGAPLLPSLDVQGSATEDRLSYNNGFPKTFLPQGWNDNGKLAASLQWDLDLWGRNRAGLAAAQSERRAAAIDAQQARLMLATAIALSYADLARLFEDVDTRRAALVLRQSSERLVAQRVAVGVDMRGSQRLAEAQTANARADLAAAEEALLLRRHQLAALLGAGPDRGLAISRPQWTPASARALPAGLATDLIARRPDVAIARERVEAAAARIKVARADFFPSIRLSALIGVQSLGLSQLFTSDSFMGSAGPAIGLPLFHGGALRGRYRGTQASYDEAVADYNRTVLAAYQQAADAVTSRAAIAARLVDARAALSASEEAHAIARRRYEGGLSTYLDVLAVEDRMLQARLFAQALEAANRSADIALIRAIGGGFAPGGMKNAKDFR